MIMNPDLLGTLQTVTHLHQFKKDLLYTRDQMYLTDPHAKENALNKLIDEYSFIEKNTVNSPQDIDKMLFELESLSKTVSEVKVVSAIKLHNDTVNIIFNSISQTVGKPILLSLEIDESIVGGLKITVNGKEYDYSLLKLTES